ncbi:hypothetical protein [Nocardia sp. NPDC057668]|uniref:hypothetical protein n=1 Tax=Nocardia sp. NPDC057668 TaxID=3346202 RepID=UPI003670750A
MTAANTTGAGRLLIQILNRYDTLDEFLAHIRQGIDAPTDQLPRVHPDDQG